MFENKISTITATYSIGQWDTSTIKLIRYLKYTPRLHSVLQLSSYLLQIRLLLANVNYPSYLWVVAVLSASIGMELKLYIDIIQVIRMFCFCAY